MSDEPKKERVGVLVVVNAMYRVWLIFQVSFFFNKLNHFRFIPLFLSVVRDNQNPTLIFNAKFKLQRNGNDYAICN